MRVRACVVCVRVRVYLYPCPRPGVHACVVYMFRSLGLSHVVCLISVQYIYRVDRHELAQAIHHYGGEHPLAARRIADAIALAKRDHSVPERTGRFGEFVRKAKGLEYQAMHPAKMTFQALRIVVNREYDELRGGMFI